MLHKMFKLLKSVIQKRSSVNISGGIGGNILVSLSERVLGRVIAENIKNPVTGELLLKKIS